MGLMGSLGLALVASQAWADTCTGFRPSRLDTRGIAELTRPISVLPADFNSDGVPDVAIVNKYIDGFLVDGSVTVLKGDLSGRYTLASNQVIAGSSTWAAIDDFNKDGIPDVAAVNYTSVMILLGNGTGGFQPRITIPVGFDAIHVAVADMDADGASDLVLTQQYIGQPNGRITVMRGNGAGGFSAMTPGVVGQDPRGAVTGDFNGDGKKDVVAGSNLSNNITFLPGLGNGTFGASTVSGIGASSLFFAASDLDGDGNLDLIATGETVGREIVVLRGAGDGTFGVMSYVPLAINSPRNPLLCDFDRDGKLDLAVPNAGSGDVLLLYGNGNGSFDAPLSLGVDGSPAHGQVADIDQDGRCDVVTANDASVSALLGSPRRVLGTPTLPAGAAPLGGVSGDFDRDGKLDLAVASRDTDSVLIFRGDGEGGMVLAQTLAAGLAPDAIAAGDFNLDGAPDLVVANQGVPGDQQNDTLKVLTNDTTGWFTLTHSLTVGDLPLDVKTGDFNGDGRPDVVAANSRSDKVTFYFAQATGFGNAKNIRIGFEQRSLAVADLNGDGVLDVAIALMGQNAVLPLLGTPQGGFQKGATVQLGGTSTISQIAAADLNGDAAIDLVAVSQGADLFGPGELTVLIGGGDATFATPHPTLATGALPYAVAVLDLDRAGGVDVAVSNRLDNDVMLFTGDGTGLLTGGIERYGAGIGPVSLMPADFNRDSRTDLATVDFDGSTASILLNSSAIADPIDALLFESNDHLSWDAVPGPVSYRVYRGQLGELSLEEYGQCASPTLSLPEHDDPSSPPAGEGYFYLASVVSSGLEGPLGYSTSCLKRPNLHPCLP
jgi:hypothetical protein